MKDFKYTRIWLLLAVALAAVSIFSFIGEVKVGEWVPKKAPMAEYLLADAEADSVAKKLKADSIALVEMQPKIIETDTLPQSIFIFGDSMTFNLALRLAKYARRNSHQINSVNWDSSNTKIWAESDTLDYFIDKFHPTQIFISLGSNEVYFKNPEVRAPYVKKIIEKIGDIPFVWIGPPNWNEDTGINDMLQRICGNGRFFRSAGMEFKRKKDKIHPTKESSALWIDSIARWLPKSDHPILMEIPSDSMKNQNPHIVFLKALNK